VSAGLGVITGGGPERPAPEDEGESPLASFARAAPVAVWMDAEPREGWLNMSIDEALLERAQAGERWLRLYRWDPWCLSFGRHEPADRRYDAGRIAALGLSVVRRPTGGRAVWHARELTYAIAMPVSGLGSLRGTYLEIHAMLRDAIRTLGARADLAPVCRAAPVDAGACFASPAGGEVMVEGRKVVGSAQRRSGGALLQHGSVLLQDDQSVVTSVSRGTPSPDLGTPLGRLLGRTIPWQEAADAVVRAAGGRWPLAGEGPPGGILGRAAACASRYRSPAWTWSGTASA
jgi:lipoyl(octanoyl) transferase